MIEAQADVALGEAIRPAAEAHRRVYGGGPSLIAYSAVLFALCLILSGIAGRVLFPIVGSWSGIISLMILMLGAVGAIIMYGRLHLRGFLKSLRKMGSPAVFPTRFRFDEQGIATRTDRVSHSVPWEAVQFIVRAPEHWLAQIDTTTLAIPVRAFATSEDERAFVELAKSRLREAALKRSVFDSQ
jgi:hypothetical protein